jgi:hypothetical protein
MIDQNTIQVYEISKNNISGDNNNNSMAGISKELRAEIKWNVMFYSAYRLKKKYKVSVGYLANLKLENEREYNISSKAVLGSKTAPYFTEDEMLNGFSARYEDLSPSEKAIYNRL